MKFLRVALALLGAAFLGWLATPTTAQAVSVPHAHVERGGALTAGSPAQAIGVHDACELEEARGLLTGAAVVPQARFRPHPVLEAPPAAGALPMSSVLRCTSLPARQ